MARSITLPLTAAVRLLQTNNLGEPHAVLAGGERYYSPRFKEENDRELRAQLGDTDPGDLYDALSLIQHADTEYYGWVDAGNGDEAILLAGLRGNGAMLIRSGDTVTIQRTGADRLAETLVAHLPGTRPGRGESISIRADEYGKPQSDSRMQVARSSRPHGVRRMEALLAAPRFGGGKLYAATRDDEGRRVRSVDWVTYLDIEDYGRWLVYAAEGRGERAVTAVPGTPDRFAAKLHELARTI
jgi:ESX secretion-associated protein EspG